MLLSSTSTAQLHCNHVYLPGNVMTIYNCIGEVMVHTFVGTTTREVFSLMRMEIVALSVSLSFDHV